MTNQYDGLILDAPEETAPGGERDWEAESLFRFRAYTRDDLDHLPPPDPLIDGLLPARGLAMLAGSRGLGKSLLALSIAGSVATDLPTWTGLPVRHHGTVLFVSLEGFHGVPKRVRAWEAWQRRRTDQLLWLPSPIDLRRRDDAHLLGAFANHHDAKLIVVDSARATGAGAEDTKDMGAYVAGLEIVQSHTDALVLVLHNTGWDGTRERGSTLLPDACDTTLILEGEPDGIRTLKHRKHRDGDMLESPLAFRFCPVDGTHSGVLVPTDTPTHDTRQDRVLSYVIANPGLSTGVIARELGLHRPNVATTLTALTAAGLVRNDGTPTRPAWTSGDA